jgi:hypothetical protein
MRRLLYVITVFGIALSITACFSTSLGNLVSTPPAEDPSSGRLSAINNQLAAIDQQLAQLHSDRAIAETQRNESLIEMAKLTGMGPKPPSMGDFGSETLTVDPGMMISMHNANITIARETMKEIDAKIEQAYQQAATLKAERAKIEQAIAQSSRTSFSGPGACFTPDTQVRLPQGTKSISTLSAGEPVLAYDEETGQLAQSHIAAVLRGREDHYFLINNDLRATAMHRFLTESGWVRAKDLEPGMKLKTAEGWTVLTSKKLIDADIEVFNLEVDEHHDFFVLGAKESYLVHNSGGGGGK